MFHFPYVFTFFVSPFIRKYSRQVSEILEFLFQRYLHLSLSYMVCTPGLYHWSYVW